MTFRLFLFALMLAAIALPMSSRAGEIELPESAGEDFRVPVLSMKELKESRVVKQNYDFSCGSAAVATLLTFSYNQPTTERQAFDMMWEVGNQEHIKKFGFSLLDMQKYLANRGYHAVGYKISLDKLRQLHVPAIALINPNGYNHFVVVRGWRNDAAIVADPAQGVRRMSTEDFQSVWNGIVFLLKDQTELAQSHYNDVADFKVLPRSQLSEGMLYANNDMSSPLMNIPIFNDY